MPNSAERNALAISLCASVERLFDLGLCREAEALSGLTLKIAKDDGSELYSMFESIAVEKDE